MIPLISDTFNNNESGSIKKRKAKNQFEQDKAPIAPRNKSPFQVQKIIPEILRYQFFRKRSSDPNDCLLDVCEKRFQEIKRDGNSDVLRGDTRTKNKHGENQNAQVIVRLFITAKYSINPRAYSIFAIVEFYL